MDLALYILLIVCLGAIAYQDVKMRQIHFILPIAIFLLAIILNWDVMYYLEIGKSIAFLALNFIVLTVYFSIKSRRFVNPFVSMMGIGDVLFLFAVLPLFSFRNYLLFFVLGMLFSLLLFLLFKSKYLVDQTIPLAGYLSIFIVGLMGASLFIDTHLLLKAL